MTTNSRTNLSSPRNTYRSRSRRPQRAVDQTALHDEEAWDSKSNEAKALDSDARKVVAPIREAQFPDKRQIKSPTKLPKPTSPPRSLQAKLKAEQTVTLGNGRKFGVGGIGQRLGERLVWCREGDCFVLTDLRDWHGGGSDASAKLRDHGLIIISGFAELRAAVDQLKRFPVGPVVNGSGWSKYGFALPNGRMVGTKGKPEPLRNFMPIASIVAAGGTLEGWIEEVATPLSEHLLASFFMMTMFAPALLRLTSRSDNFALELAGDAARGKSTLQHLIASAAGPSVGAWDMTYWRSLNSTMAALETVMTTYNDLPLILDEAGLIPGGGKVDTRAEMLREFGFKVSEGFTKARFGDAQTRQFRTIAIISTNRPISTLLGGGFAAEGPAIADRIISLPLTDRQEGVTCSPKLYQS